ncbi:hypothetical protein [Myxococcus stipitatus]|uniref:hypothetical protein n=1 Tax=Myxococcus stipitatus TaxID=83455 RepID=UPI0030CEEE7C
MARQAAWRLISRELFVAPFNYNTATVLNISNKLFYQGSGNIGFWHACNCSQGTLDGCAANNGYMQWLAADDDNGDLRDGTPHMTAIYNAFESQRIGCNVPAPVNSGCAGGPTEMPTLTLTPTSGAVMLSWTPVPSATRYWVMKSDGDQGCVLGQARIATVTGTSYEDTEVLSGHKTCYSVAAVGNSEACFSPWSYCRCI